MWRSFADALMPRLARRRWQFTETPDFGLWMALYDGHGLGSSRVADRARRMLLPLCALGAPARGGVISWSRRGELQESYDPA